VAIQPIDLQTLYTQLDKIGKSQVQQQQAAQAARDQDMAKNVQDAAERLRTVHGTEAGDESAGAVHERGSSGEEPAPNPDKKQKDSQNDEPAPDKEIIQDPALGKHIDISG